MLKNISASSVTLQWNGVQTTLLPGQTCHYSDQKIEQRMTWKHGNVLQLIVESKPEPEKPPLVVVDEKPSDEESGDPAPVEAPKKRGRPSKK